MRSVIIKETVTYRMTVPDYVSDDAAMDVFCEFTEEETEALEVGRDMEIEPG